jgi:DNA polymerase III alpha subunit
MIPLHVHSNYTLLKGTVPVERVVEQAIKNKLPAIALTDTNSMQGIVPFVKAARENNIKPIIGCLIDDPNNENKYVILLARNNKGYSNICKIITSRKLNDDFSLVHLLEDKLENLFIITPSVEILEIIGKRENLFVELIASKKEKQDNRKRFDCAEENRIKYVVTNPVYFLSEEDHLLHKTLSAIRLRSTIDNLLEDDFVSEEYYFKKLASIEHVWRNLPDALTNSEVIAADCSVDLKLNEYKFPVFSIPPNETADSLLWKESNKGLEKKYEIVTDKIKQRLKMELSVIREMGFSNYFLIVWDIVNEAKKRGLSPFFEGVARIPESTGSPQSTAGPGNPVWRSECLPCR